MPLYTLQAQAVTVIPVGDLQAKKHWRISKPPDTTLVFDAHWGSPTAVEAFEWCVLGIDCASSGT